jgi:hypothetical protein
LLDSDATTTLPLSASNRGAIQTAVLDRLLQAQTQTQTQKETGNDGGDGDGGGNARTAAVAVVAVFRWLLREIARLDANSQLSTAALLRDHLLRLQPATVVPFLVRAKEWETLKEYYLR